MKAALNQISEAHDSPEPLVIYGYDRIALWIDSSELPISKAGLEKFCTKVEATLMQMPHNARWKLKVELHQPTFDCLRLLKKAFGHDIAASINYIENAVDVLASSKDEALRIRNYLLASVKLPYLRHPVVLSEHGTIFYFGPRIKQKGNKLVRNERVVAVYADKPSKILNARPSEDAVPCAHAEFRVSGSAAIADIGIVSLDDLINFDHPNFWGNSLRFYELPERKVLGYQLAKAANASLDVTDAAFRKRAANWVLKYSIQDSFGSNFIMHNAMLDDPEFCKLFKPQSFENWLDELTWL
jgi:hypothetical protein